MLPHHHKKQLQLINKSWLDCLLLLMSGTVNWEPQTQIGLPVNRCTASEKGYISLLVLLDLRLVQSVPSPNECQAHFHAINSHNNHHLM